MFYKLYHPEIFQGSLVKKKYFEGWYFKLVSADMHHAIAIIPGIAIFDASDRHAFIQVFDGVRHTTNYHKFPIEDFVTDKKELDVSIGNNRFTINGIQLDLPEIKGEISFSNMITPVTSLLSPGVMGSFSFVPLMQCKHEVVSLHHQLTGKTSGDFGDINWDSGIGYIEKDWGSSFPKCWIWIHTNHFNSEKPVSLMASVAHIPWMGRFFVGFIVVFRVDDKEYRFATYNHSMMKCHVSDDQVSLDFRKNDLHFSIIAHPGETAPLHTPVKGQMTGKLNESMAARVDVSLKKGDHTILTLSGSRAGLDVAGDTTILESPSWRK